MSPRRSRLAFWLLIAIAMVFAPRLQAAPPAITVGFCTDDLEAAKAAGFDYAERARPSTSSSPMCS